MPTKKPQFLVTVTEEMNDAINTIVLSDGWNLDKSISNPGK